MRISDLSSDVCSSDLSAVAPFLEALHARLWRTVRHNSRSASPSSEMYSKRAIGRRRTSSSRLQEALGTERQAFAKLRIQPCAKKSKNLRMSSFQAARSSASSGWARTGSASSNCESATGRSDEHTSELQSLMRISYAVFCLKKKN